MVGVWAASPRHASSKAKLSWPKSIPDQVQAVRESLERQPGPASTEQIARQFKRARTDRVQELLETLSTLGQVRSMGDGRFMI